MKIEFQENQECLELISKKSGLISLSDEEPHYQKGTNLILVSELKRNLNDKSCLKGNMENTLPHFIQMYQIKQITSFQEFFELNLVLLQIYSCRLLKIFLHIYIELSYSVSKGKIESTCVIFS